MKSEVMLKQLLAIIVIVFMYSISIEYTVIHGYSSVFNFIGSLALMIFIFIFFQFRDWVTYEENRT